jgi:protein gp37
MADKTPIEWTDATWNPIAGCSVISPGCTNCYAMREAGTRLRSAPKFEGLTQPSKAGPVWTGDMRLWEKALGQPLRWEKPRRIFVNSMSDLFHESVPDEWIDRIFAIMALCPQHTFQVLTKRAERMRDYQSGRYRKDDIYGEAAACLPLVPRDRRWAIADARQGEWPLSNIWLGVSVEDQERLERIRELLATAAAVRWVSLEPLLGQVDLERLTIAPALYLDALTGAHSGEVATSYAAISQGNWQAPPLPPRRPSLDWVVLGGESGPGARPMDSAWARAVRDQCRAAHVPFFFKQWGEWLPRDQLGWRDPTESFDGCEWTADHVRVGKKAAGRHLDGKTWDEYPRGSGDVDKGQSRPL